MSCSFEFCPTCPKKSSFGELPQPPPFAPTQEELVAAMNKVLDKQPFMRWPTYALVQAMHQEMKVNPVHFHKGTNLMIDFLVEQSKLGTISLLRGPRGGIKRNRPSQFGPSSVASHIREEITPAINDHICPGCGNDKCSKTESTCWKCGGNLH